MVRIFFLILIIFNLFLSAFWLLQGDIHYDVDVSRDLLVMDDIVRNFHLTLLGPRSGAIPGIFHGPLWFYINLPAFLIGGGDPLVVGWFWFLLSAIFLLIIYWVSKKLFGFEVALLSVLLFSVNSIINPSIGLKNFYNPYGAVFLFPLFFWLFYHYLSTSAVKYLIICLFILGLIIQFQMAFGIPLFVTITVYLSYFLFQRKKLFHLLSYFILLLPLSTFIVFDLKHNFLQLNAFIQFFHKNNQAINLLDIFGSRAQALLFDFFDLFSPGKNLLTVFFAICFLILFMVALRKASYPTKKVYWLFGYLFLSFWIISLFYPGGVGNYFWPLLPLVVIIFCSFYKFVRREIFIAIFVILYLINLYAGVLAITEFRTNINQRGPHSWAFNLSVAQKVYEDAKGDFGYFNYSPDRFAYQQRYAMIYARKNFPNINSFSSVKKSLTYLLEVDPPKDRPELSGINWRISDVGIDRSPDQVFHFDFIKVEKYLLNSEEVKIKTNPYLMDSVFLR